MSSSPRIEYEKYVLPNGLQVILHVDRRLPVVHVNQWYHVGSKNERPGRTGFAHLFEHLMFEGSKNADGEYFKYVEKIGANLREGGVNGTTSNDRTNYFVTAPSGTLEYLLWLESDRLTGLLDAMTQEKLDNQRDVVRNERRQTVENRPYGRAFATIFENVFPAGHPYSWPVIGSHEDLVAASLEDVKEFFRTYYTPNNLTLTLAGDFDPDEARRLIETYYAGVMPGPSQTRLGPLPAPFRGERRLSVHDNVGQARTYLVWPAVPFYHPDEADLDLAATILTTGLSSRLNRRLVYQEELCTSVSASMYGMEIAGLFLVMASARRRRARPHRVGHRAGDPPPRRGRPHHRRAGPRPHPVRARLRQRARAHRRLRRQGRSPGSLQHLPRRPGILREGSRALPPRDRGLGAPRGRALPGEP